MTARKESKHSKKGWAGGFTAPLAIILSAGLLLTPIAVQAGVAKKSGAAVANEKQIMKYDVYAGGFHVVSADLNIDLAKKDSYFLRLAAYTHGTLAKLAPWKGIFQTNGWFDAKNEKAQPQLHFSDTTWKDEKEVTEFHFNKDGSFREYRVRNEKENKTKEPEVGLTEKSTDVLTATLKVMDNVAKTGKCEGANKIFDGERSYHLIFHHKVNQVLKKSEYNVYAGPATECTIEVKPLAGKWHSKPRGWMSIQEQGRERGTMPTIWLAQMASGEPAVPVKIRVKTDYGTLFMHLTHYQGAGKTLDLPKE